MFRPDDAAWSIYGTAGISTGWPVDQPAAVDYFQPSHYYHCEE